MGFFQFLEQVIFMPLVRYPLLGSLAMLIVFIVLVVLVWRLRMYVIQYKFILKKKWITLEIRLPKEVERSPAAMEVFMINGLYHSGGVGNPYKKYWLGKVLNWLSLEIVSFGGSVHFYIRCHKWMKDTVEAQLYAQYPQVEIIEVEDYTDRIPPYERDSGWNLYGGTFFKEQPDVYPIKTYKDWGVDRHYESLDVEQQIDPLSSLIEAMSVLRPGEEWWVQFIITAHKGRGWHKAAEKEIVKLQKKYRDRIITSDEARQESSSYSLTEGERDTIHAIERGMEKFRFKVGIRTIYMAKKENYDGNKHLFVKNMFSPFASQHLNRLKRVTYTGFDNPWADYMEIFNTAKKKRFLEDYRNREYHHHMFKFTWFDWYMKFFDDYFHPEMTMSTEELATLFHIPGRMVQTPGIERIESRKAEPPANLPT